MNVRALEQADLPRVTSIVNWYIENTFWNFHETPLPLAHWKGAVASAGERFPWLVSETEGEVAGVAYATRWKDRAAYEDCAEVTVYLDRAQQGRGIASALYRELLARLDANGFHSQVAVIALPNDPSVALHERFGFTHAGTLREAGRKNGVWRNVGLWQRVR